jgi:hypothetical protein
MNEKIYEIKNLTHMDMLRILIALNMLKNAENYTQECKEINELREKIWEIM